MSSSSRPESWVLVVVATMTAFAIGGPAWRPRQARAATSHQLRPGNLEVRMVAPFAMVSSRYNDGTDPADLFGRFVTSVQQPLPEGPDVGLDGGGSLGLDRP